ncbi:hypothetical protein FACS1894204_00330 [Synergistales bacterium]|nr:hypothetical protein FACS1894204_00330 [Synergistales bacterium]
MSISSVSSSAGALREEYLEQQRKLQLQKQAEKAEKSAESRSVDTGKSATQVKFTAAASSAAAVSGASDTDQALIAKANSGAALTESELQTLKQLDPALYAQLVASRQSSSFNVSA